MGSKLSSFVPKYFKNFNLENRAFKQLEQIENKNTTLAPRHPSTAKILKEIEGFIKKKIFFNFLI